MNGQPRVFVSHSSEDKERFVNRFAARLRENGVDAWLDKWEMLPGDSLVDKIFEEGLKGSRAVIVVLSNASVESTWVREELNAAMVKRIETGSKLIPILLDDCSVPEALKHTIWERVKNVNSYDSEFARILAAIFGIYERPPIGEAPSYTGQFSHTIGSLSKVDSLVLRLACEHSIAEETDIVEPENVFGEGKRVHLPETELADSIEILEHYGMVRAHHLLGGGVPTFQITLNGFEEYAQACISGYADVQKNVMAALINAKLESDIDIAAAVSQPLRLVQHLLLMFERLGYFKLSRPLSGPWHVYNQSASLRRAMADGEALR
jgi:hypothetical protein